VVLILVETSHAACSGATTSPHASGFSCKAIYVNIERISTLLIMSPDLAISLITLDTFLYFSSVHVYFYI